MAYQPKSYRKFLATGVATAMVATAVAPAVSADEHVETSFTDVPEGAWYADNLEYVLERGIIEGYTDGTFRPDGQITRAEAAAVLTRAKDLEVSANASLDFTDTNDTQWYAAYVEAVVEAGYMQGDPGGTFRPNKPMSRGEFATVMVNAFDLELNENAIVEFSDLDPEDSTQWYYDNVKVLASLGIVGGFTDGTFRAESNVSRAQATAFVHRTEVPEERLDVELAGLAVEDVAAVNVLDKTTVTASVVNAYDDAEATVAITPDSSLSEEDIEEYADAVGVDLEDLVDSLTQTVDVEDGEIEAEFDLLPPGEHTVTVTVPAEDEDGEDAVGEATFTVDVLEVDELVATTEIVDGDTEEQFLEFTVNGGSAALPYFAGQGFEVEFQATEDVFVDGNGESSTSSTGELIDDLTDQNIDSFDYQVVLTDSDDNSFTSNVQSVEVQDFESTIVEISDVSVDFNDDVELKSGILSTSDDNVSIASIDGLFRDGEEFTKDEDLEDDFEFSSSDSSVALVSSTGTIVPVSAGDVVITIDADGVEYDLELTVVDEEREVDSVTTEKERIGLVTGVDDNFTIEVMDQFGDALKDFEYEIEDVEADGETILTATATPNTDNEGKATVDVSADDENEGSGTLELTASGEDDVLLSLNVLVDADDEVATRSIELADSGDDLELDVNPFADDQDVELVLNEYNAAGLKIGAFDFGAGDPEYTVRSTNESAATVVITDAPNGEFTVSSADESGTASIQVREGSITRYQTGVTVLNTTPAISGFTFSSDLELDDFAEGLDLDDIIDSIAFSGVRGDSEIEYSLDGDDVLIELVDGPDELSVGRIEAISTDVEGAGFFNGTDITLNADDGEEGTIVLRLSRLNPDGTTRGVFATTTVSVDLTN